MASLSPLFDDNDSLNLNSSSNYSPRNRAATQKKSEGVRKAVLARRRPTLAVSPGFQTPSRKAEPSCSSASADAAVWTEAPAGRPSSGRCFAEDGGARASAAAAARRPRLRFALPAPGRPHPPRQAPAGRADGRGEGGLAEVLRGAVGARPVR